MKTFKDLESGDIIYTVLLDNITREISLRKITTRFILDPEIYNKLVVYFMEKKEHFIYVEANSPSLIRTDYPENKSRGYFTTKESAEAYLKGLVKQAEDFISEIPRVYDELWSKDVIFKCGDIMKVISSDLLLLYDGEKTGYMEDWSSIEVDEELLLNSRRPTELEESIFLKRLMKSSEKPGVEDIIKKCGYNIIVGELVRNEEV